MTPRLPVLPTILVGLAVSAMIALGIWQLQRADEKAALIATYRAAEGRPAVAFPPVGPTPQAALFRRSTANCLTVVGWTVEIGRTAGGQSGYRHIAQCRTGAEGQGLLADMGVSSDPRTTTKWRGGALTGIISQEPDHNSFAARVIGRAEPLRPMLVADTPAPGLQPSAKPSPADIPNNHLSYAVQWFAFAAIAAIIYVLALRKRAAGAPRP